MLPARIIAHAQKPISVFRATTNAAAALRGTLRAGGKGFLIEPPQTIADGKVTEVLATANGSRVVVLREYFRPTPTFLLGENGFSYPLIAKPEPGEVSITVWNAFTRKSTVIWRQRVEAGTVLMIGTQGVLHSPNGDRVLVGVVIQTPEDKTEHYGLLMVDPDRNTARLVGSLSPNFATVKPAPHLPLAALLDADGTAKNGLRFLRPDGSQTAPIPMPQDIAWLNWNDNGTLLGVHFGKTESGRLPAQWYAADPQTGNLITLPARPKFTNTFAETPAPETVPELQLTTRPQITGSGAQNPSVWLEAREVQSAKGADPKPAKQGVLLSAEGTPVFLLPRGALFLSDGALFAVPIQTVREEELTAIERKQSRTKSGQIAKQIGLGILGFLQDNDEKFPASVGNFSTDIAPYLRDPQLLNGFVYTPPATLQQSKMADVAGTVLGYLPGVGGKSVLYADGHVKWEDAL